MLMQVIHRVWALAAIGCLASCGGGGGGGGTNPAVSSSGGTAAPQPTPPSSAAPAPPPLSLDPAPPKDDSPILFSHFSDLSHGAPIDGSRQLPRRAYVFLRSDSNWRSRRISQLLFRCCDLTSESPLDTNSPEALRASAEPWSTAIDLTGFVAGTRGKLEARALFADGSASDTVVSTFTIAAEDAGNSSPRLSGSAPETAVVGRHYWHRPSAGDADGDPLGFSISNAPSWLSFDTTTGTLQGRPGWNDVGTHPGIELVASDGQASSESSPFAISVEAGAPGRVTLSWHPPALRENGEPLSNLAGYRLLFGQRSRAYDEDVFIDSPGVTSYTVENLLAGPWYFVMTAVDRNGLESDPSREIVRTVR